MLVAIAPFLPSVLSSVSFRGPISPSPLRAQEAPSALAATDGSATLEIDDVAIAWPAPEFVAGWGDEDLAAAALARIPVRLSAPASADFVRVVVYFDPDALSYREIELSDQAESAGWWVTQGGFRELADGVLYGALRRREDGDGSPARELALFDVILEATEGRSIARDRLEPDVLYRRTAIAFQPIVPHWVSLTNLRTFVGRLDARQADESLATEYETRLDPGSAAYYFRPFLEVAGGELTRRGQSFSLPLYLTSFDDPDLILAGVDYDELILRGVRPARPDFVVAALDLSAEGSVTFTVDLSEDRSGRDAFLRAPIAELLFEITDSTAADSGTPVIDVVPYLLEMRRGDGHGGQTELQSLLGTLRFVEPRFVRGNLESLVRAQPLPVVEGAAADAFPSRPDIHDAMLLLRVLYLSSDRSIPCREAADVNDSGAIDLSDAVHLLAHLFRDGPPPASPYPAPGIDDPYSPSHLGCELPLPYFEVR